MIDYSLKFKEASLTGSQVLILKATTQCDCFDPEELINSEPDPNCLKCLGTGCKRQAFLTEKVRNEIYNVYQANFEITDKNKTINEQRKFYLPEYYREIGTEDLIVLLDPDLNIVTVYEITNREEFRHHDFIFFEFIGKKINYLPKFTKEQFKTLEILDVSKFINIGG